MADEAIPIGPAFAWESDGRWYFTPYRFMAPPNAIEAERIVVEGRIVLQFSDGQHGRFIYDVEQVG